VSVPVGVPALLQVQVSDGRTDLFGEASVYDAADALLVVLAASAGPGGVYTAVWTPPAPGTYSILGKFFADQERTTDAGYEWVAADVVVEGPATVLLGTTSAPSSEPVEDPPERVDPTDSALGIYQPDLILKTALVEGIRRLRQDPAEIAVVLQWVRADELVGDRYGSEVERIGEWLRSIDVPVIAEHALTGAEAVVVSVADADVQEAETTLGDLHYSVSEALPDERGQDLAGPFTALAYDARTGTLVVPFDVAASVPLQEGMLVVDDRGDEHAVAEVIADDAVVLADRVVAGFTVARIRLAEPRRRAAVESEVSRVTLRVGCHAGKPNHLIWVHSIVRYALFRYKQDLLESRGFERTVTGSGPMAKDGRFDGEGFWTRYVTVTGYCREIWRRDARDRILSTGGVLQAQSRGPEPGSFSGAPGSEAVVADPD